MNMKFLSFAGICLMLMTGAVLFAAENNVPSAFLPTDKFEFPTVAEDIEITHDFIVQNKGTAVLNIENVNTSCGCTTAFYTKEIPPGGDGKVSVKLNTTGYGGTNVSKNITVQTNDKDHPALHLTIFGRVERFATITPKNANLNGSADQPVKTTVTIIPDEKYPFRISELGTHKGENVIFNIAEVKKDKKSEYLLTVENAKKSEGRYVETISLKTDNSLRPEIRISVYGNISGNPEKKEKM